MVHISRSIQDITIATFTDEEWHCLGTGLRDGGCNNLGLIGMWDSTSAVGNIVLSVTRDGIRTTNSSSSCTARGIRDALKRGGRFSPVCLPDAENTDLSELRAFRTRSGVTIEVAEGFASVARGTDFDCSLPCHSLSRSILGADVSIADSQKR